MHVIQISFKLLWWAFLLCWAGLLFAVLGPSILDEGVVTGPIVTTSIRFVHKLCLFVKKPWSRAHDRQSYYGRVMASRCNKIKKEIRSLLRQNMSHPKP